MMRRVSWAPLQQQTVSSQTFVLTTTTFGAGLAVLRTTYGGMTVCAAAVRGRRRSSAARPRAAAGRSQPEPEAEGRGSAPAAPAGDDGGRRLGDASPLEGGRHLCAHPSA
jgi:hypothetical protein